MHSLLNYIWTLDTFIIIIIIYIVLTLVSDVACINRGLQRWDYFRFSVDIYILAYIVGDSIILICDSSVHKVCL